MGFRYMHTNLNVREMEKSIEFYEQALGLTLSKRRRAEDGSYEIVFLNDGAGDVIELTWLHSHPEAYELSDNETHIAFCTSDFEAAHEKHEKMGCICFENEKMGLYFIEDPDGYWLEILPEK